MTKGFREQMGVSLPNKKNQKLIRRTYPRRLELLLLVDFNKLDLGFLEKVKHALICPSETHLLWCSLVLTLSRLMSCHAKLIGRQFCYMEK